jgi:hypothetical protein
MASAQSRMPGAVGLLPPRYRDPERLAGGGMGEVYRAVDGELERPVALKLLAEPYAADAELRQRFTREALAAARLSAGPNTVTIYDVGEWRSRPYIVMEYLSGGSLEQRLRTEGKLRPDRVVPWLAEAAAALDHAHANGVVHRDVKPANLLFDRQHVLHVADFGVASAAGLASLTQTGTVLGTAGYLAPEQADGKPVTAAADRYALAVVAFELLTGGRPFERDSPTAEAAAHLAAPIPHPSERNPELPRQLDAVFERALAKTPRARFASCLEFVAALRDGLDRPAAAGRVNAAATTRIRPAARGANPPARLRPALVSALLALLAAGGGVLAFALTRGHDAGTAAPTVRTITAAAPAQTVTVTAPAPTQPTTTAPAATSTTPASSGADLLRQAQALIQAGNDPAALPPLQQAVQLLQGSGTPDEGNADYTLASTTIQLGSCDGVLPLLDRAQTILGNQPQIDQLRATCTGPPGHRPGHGNGNG